MCSRPDFEGKEKEMDDKLVSLFQAYCRWLETWVPNLSIGEKIDCFKTDMGDRLEALKDKLEGENV